MTHREAAKRLGVCPRTVAMWIEHGRLPGLVVYHPRERNPDPYYLGSWVRRVEFLVEELALDEFIRTRGGRLL